MMCSVKFNHAADTRWLRATNHMHNSLELMVSEDICALKAPQHFLSRKGQFTMNTTLVEILVCSFPNGNHNTHTKPVTSLNDYYYYDL
jgi:hypothetical protein